MSKFNGAQQRPSGHAPDSVPDRTRQASWIACAEWRGRTRTRDTPRSCITSTSIACGRRTGRSAQGRPGATRRRGGLRAGLGANLRDLHARVHRGALPGEPSRRVYIQTPDGRQRPLGVAALEDKVLQRAVVEVLNAVYGKRRTTGMSKGMRGSTSKIQRLTLAPSHGKRRTTGMEKGMEESYVEDLASHDGPDPCVGDPRGRSEALDTGCAQAGLLSREMGSFGVPTRSWHAEGNTAGGVLASRQWTLRGRRSRACA